MDTPCYCGHAYAEHDPDDTACDVDGCWCFQFIADPDANADRNEQPVPQPIPLPGYSTEVLRKMRCRCCAQPLLPDTPAEPRRGGLYFELGGRVLHSDCRAREWEARSRTPGFPFTRPTP